VNDARPEVALASSAGFDEVFRGHYPRLVRALTVACGDPEVAADAVQEAFLRAHLRWKQLLRQGDPVVWVRRVAINAMRDHFRHETRGAKVLAVLASDPQWLDGPGPDGPGPDSTAVSLLATLPPQQRLALSLYYLEGLSVAEVASAMALSVGAVKFHMSQGRERLRPALAEAGHG
jgi:RNA polymerase sigma-70 factor (ECF subfamily)